VGAIVALDPARRRGARAGLGAGLRPEPLRPPTGARGLAAADPIRLFPLQNRALQSAYSPGSVFKIVMAAAGLAEGVVTPGQHACTARASPPTTAGASTAGSAADTARVDLESALEGSCDVYFYASVSELGIERIAEYARRFGLGQPTGIDLDGERSGLVPDDEWSRRVRGTPGTPARRSRWRSARGRCSRRRSRSP
jgi:penicillin-binding protein 2